MAEYRNGKAHENEIDEDGEYIVVNSKFVSTNAEIRKFSNAQNEPLYENEIAFVLSDVPNGRAIARTFLVDKSGKYTLNQRIAGITPHEDTDPYYLHIRMNRNAYFLKFDDGNKQTNLSIKDVLNYEDMYPSYKEQQKIGSYFGKLDHLITLHQRKCDETKQLKKFMLQKMFPKNGEKNPEIRFEGFTDDWEQRKFGELVNEIREKTKSENEDTLLSCAIDGMYLNSELFSHFRGSSSIGYLKVKKNDLILSAQNLHLGNCNVNLRFEHGIISPAYKVYELVDCNPLFIQAWVKQDSTKDFFLKASTEGASVCRKNIVWEELYEQTVSVPEIKEQEKIGYYFQSLDHLITLHQRKCEKLKELKKFMLQKMFV